MYNINLAAVKIILDCVTDLKEIKCNDNDGLKEIYSLKNQKKEFIL